MKTITFTLAFLAAVAGAFAQEEPAKTGAKKKAINWRENYAGALQEAARTSRPLLIDFEADWCGWCKKLDRETFGNGDVIRLVEQFFIPVRIDTDREPKLSAKFEVRGLPTILLLGPNEKELQRLSGFRPADKFLSELRQTIKTAASLDELKKAAKKSPSDLGAVRAWARAVFASGDGVEAEKILAGALERNPLENSLLLDIADLKKAGGNTDEARKLYERILASGEARAGESYHKAHLPLGRLLLGKKDYQGALKILSAYTGLGKDIDNLAEAFFLRSYAYSVLDRDVEALADLHKVQDLDPDGDYGARAAYIIDLVDRKE